MPWQASVSCVHIERCRLPFAVAACYGRCRTSHTEAIINYHQGGRQQVSKLPQSKKLALVFL